MADYGLVVRNSAGTITLDTTDTITRFRHSETANAGEDDSVVLSDISGKKTVMIGLCDALGLVANCPHVFSRSGTTISWTHRHAEVIGGIVEGSTEDTLLVVFLYD
jgi:hypothetical protein